ncbi:MAG: sialidase family protein, partial [Blastocatellia bacterium]
LNTNSGKQFVQVARSTDGGATFQPPVRVGKKGGENIGAIPRVGPDGAVYVVWLGAGGGACGNAFFISRSNDGGATWSSRRSITKVCAPGVQGLRTGDGLPSFAVNPATGFMYVAWQDRRLTPTGHAGQAVMITSTDRGNTWSAPVRISAGPDDAPVFTVVVAAMADQQVAVSYYSLQNDPQRAFLADEYVRVSPDGGKTFAPSVRVTPASFDLRQAALADSGFPFLGDYQGIAGAKGTFHLLWINPGIASTITGKPQPEALSSSAE